MSMPKTVQTAFEKRLSQMRATVPCAAESSKRIAKVANKGCRYSDKELETMLKDNPDIDRIPTADVRGIIAGGKGKALKSFNHWM